jgi:hypothetical protein
MTDMIPRAEADALVVKRQKEIEAVVGLMEPYVNSVEQVTMRVMFAEYYHGAKFINVIGRRDGVEKRFEADWLKHLPRALADAVNEATKMTVPIAALDKMLAEAEKRGEKRGMLRAAEIAGDLDPEKPTNYLHRREDIPAAIRAEAGD